MEIDPKKSSARQYHGCTVVSVLIDHAREVRGDTGPMPPGHDGWEHLVVTASGEKLGDFTTLHDAIEAARLNDPKPSPPAADAGSTSASPTGAEPPAAGLITPSERKVETLLESK